MDIDKTAAAISGLASKLGLMLAWFPDLAVSFAVLVLALAVALACEYIVMRLGRPELDTRRAFLGALLTQARGPIRLALIIFALSVALPATRFDAIVTAAARHGLLIAFIAFMGWVAIIALGIAARLYLNRFQVDAEDNLLARKHLTQVRILERAADTLIIVMTAAWALMTFDSVRQYGVSLFASAGAAGIVAGLAARPMLSNLIAGVQIAMTQPIRLEDSVVVENEWGWIEEITATYVVVRLWDWRRLVVPLSYFIEKPFQNWPRQSAAVIGSVLLYVDYNVPVARIRDQLNEVVGRSKLWDRAVVSLQVTDAKEGAVELRALVSARNASAAWDLRCEVREQLIAFLQQEYPDSLPRRRSEVRLTELREVERGGSETRRGEIAEFASDRGRRS